ncbi:MAG: tyrosine-type recombinase/integrase [Hyphomicrobium sp.]|uniref:tyrosine-type recombinase/integrase n=1 Tax=Hyphomicrobium sp. TaxID=82 RepID=UPI003D0CAFBD
MAPMKLMDRRNRREPDGVAVTDLPAPAVGNKVYYDSAVKGFGVRVTQKGARSFILNYRTRSGRERRYTIGSWPDWDTEAARAEAKRLKQLVDQGEDPLAGIEAERAAPTIEDLCERYLEEHAPKKRSGKDDEAMIQNDILPALKHHKVADVTFADVNQLHLNITNGKGRIAKGKGDKRKKFSRTRKAPVRANRVVALLSKMFSLAIRWGWRPDNPAKGIERNPESKRHRFLSGEELGRLLEALAGYTDQEAANIVRLLLLSGARTGEVKMMRWADLNLREGTWTKPGSATKQDTLHHVPLSAPARQLLAGLRGKASADAEYVFPDWEGRKLNPDWDKLKVVAKIKDVRPHDLRHTYASYLASAGLSLPIIGALLGHSTPATTARYAHLFIDPLKDATERVGAIISPPSGEGADVRKISER